MTGLDTLLLRTAAASSMGLRGLLRPRPQDCLLVAPSVTGSLGDEAMLRGGIRALQANGSARIGILCYEPKDDWLVGDSSVDQAAIPGLLRQPTTARLLRFSLFAARYSTIVFIGADCLDGGYGVPRELARLTLARYAFECGLKVVIGTFSFNRAPDPALTQTISALPPGIAFRVRDPCSLSRFELATGRRAQLTADAAFLVDQARPPEEAGATRAWIAAQRSRGRLVVGLNLNRLFLRLVAEGEGCMVRLVLELLRRHSGLALTLIPHDRRSRNADEVLHARVAGALPVAVRDRVFPARCPATSVDARSLVSLLDFVLTQRMHLAIASLCCEVPMMCFEYQDKAEGMLAHFGLSDMIIRPGECADAGKLAVRILDVVGLKRALQVERIRVGRSRVMSLARHNFD